MAVWWLCGGYVFPVVVKPEILTFELKFDPEGQGQSPPKTIGVLTKVFCTSGLNLVTLAWIGDELWCGQDQNWVNLGFQVKFDLEDQWRLPPKTIGALTKVFCTFGPNLVILTWTGPELSCGQASDWYTDTRTHGHTDGGNDNTRRPKLASGKEKCTHESELKIHGLSNNDYE